MKIGLYIHIPFCQRKCLYCDFNSYAGLDALQLPYTQALIAEMESLAGREAWQAKTIFIGGGTPTLLPLPLLTQVLDAARSNFCLPANAEITVEANPGTIDAAYLSGLVMAGVNRLSLGAQSFHNDELRLMGRIHTTVEIEAALRAARRAGLENINIDLIYGLPGQSLDRWRSTLEQALSFSPEHLSLYSLTIEENTPFAKGVARGDLLLPDDDIAAQMYELAGSVLGKTGYEHYEISNWAKNSSKARPADQEPPFACKHNLIYWRNEAYLGLGAGAHSWWGGRRWHNCLSPQEYVSRAVMPVKGESPWQNHIVAGIETIGTDLAMGETMMLGLRLLGEGVPLASFENRFGRSLLDIYGTQVGELQAAGLLELLPNRVRLTRRGRLLGNQVFVRFLPDTQA